MSNRRRPAQGNAYLTGYLKSPVWFARRDRWFGTHHLPADAWPAGYGIAGVKAPEGYLRQLLWGFGRRR